MAVNNTVKKKKRKNKNGMELSLAIVIINVMIALVLILLCVLIYLHLNGQIDVEKDKTEEEIQGSATAITTVAPETEKTEQKTTDSVSSGDDAALDGDDAALDGEGTVSVTAASGEGSVPVDAFTSTSYSEGFYDNSLFIGDSISTGLVAYEYLSSNNVFAQIGLNPESVFSVTDDNGDTAISKAAAMQPDKIFIMLGSNGLAFMGTSYMSGKISQLVDTLVEKCPSSSVYVISITPVTAVHEAEGNEVMADITEYNSLLATVCKDKGVTYIDLCSHFKNADGYFADTYAEADGLHFLGTAYVEMLNFIYSKIA